MSSGDDSLNRVPDQIARSFAKGSPLRRGHEKQSSELDGIKRAVADAAARERLEQRWHRRLEHLIRIERQRRPRRWIFFAEIAEAFSRIPSVLEADKRLSQLAYKRLIDSVRAGKFETGGRAQLRW